MTRERPRILVVDDEQVNLKLLEAMLTGWGYPTVIATNDPTAAIDLVAAHDPDLLLLDLQMPALDGFAILAKLADRLRGSISLPVLVLTADASTATKERALAAGARDFLTKPFHFEEARLRVANLLAVREAQLKQHAIEDELERRVRSRTAELEVARTETLERLALAGEFRDEHTGQHTRRVASAARKLARQLGWGNDDADRLALAAPLHDIGKIAIPDSILLTPGPLTVAERRNMERHTVIGSRLLGDSPDPILRCSCEIARSHHERWDGSGYPDRASGLDIPSSARIVAIVDVFDALTHERPYKHAWPVWKALEEVESQRGRHFDPVMVDAFLALDHPSAA